jgi:hypothetical protein
VLHERPLLAHLHPRVVASQLLDVASFRLGQAVGEPEDGVQLVCFLGRRVVGRLPVLPDGDDHEPEQHGVGHSQDRVDEAGHVVVLQAPLDGHQALDQDQSADRSRDEQQDQEQAENDFDRNAPSLDLLLIAWTFADFSRSVLA